MFEDVKSNKDADAAGAAPSPEPAVAESPAAAALPSETCSEVRIEGEPWVIRHAHPPVPAETEPGAAEGEHPEEQAEEEEEEARRQELEAWKDALLDDFETWLEQLEVIHDPEEEEEQSPDLYSFYEQLAAANAETRKANRRTAEVISQWGETLARFDESLSPLRQSVADLAAAQPKPDEMSRAHCLALIEVMDRLERIAAAFESPPRSSWWAGKNAAWHQAWEAQRQALTIVLGHLRDLLKNQGVTRLDTMGKPFDPSAMNAVAVDQDVSRPVQVVLEEIAAGYARHDELLRLAQVKVSRRR
jgi:molecular chaperone GrpE